MPAQLAEDPVAMPDRLSALVASLVAANGRWLYHLAAEDLESADTELVLIQTLETEIAKAA